MNVATPKNGAVIVTECRCGKAIVWSQLDNCWLHQRTYYKGCPETAVLVPTSPPSQEAS